MDQLQDSCSKPDILGLATNISLRPRSEFSQYDHAKTKISKNSLKTGISEEEMKIRIEIEREIERDLEEEIKRGIYQQVLQLHRLYQNQKQRRLRNVNINKELLEVNITIRTMVEGGIKIEIKETKKETSESCRPRISRPDTDVKRLDWVKSLRSMPAGVMRKNVGCYRTKMPENEQCRCGLKPNSDQRSVRGG